MTVQIFSLFVICIKKQSLKTPSTNLTKIVYNLVSLSFNLIGLNQRVSQLNSEAVNGGKILSAVYLQSEPEKPGFRFQSVEDENKSEHICIR